MIKCQECGKECKSEFGLKSHMRVHVKKTEKAPNQEKPKEHGFTKENVARALWSKIKDGEARGQALKMKDSPLPLPQALKELSEHPAIRREGLHAGQVQNYIDQLSSEKN